MKKTLIVILCSVVLATAFYLPAFAAEFKIDARGAILVDAASGQVLYEYNSDTKLYPASMTKIMTLLLAAEALEQGKVKLTDKVRASEYACGFGGSQVWLEPGEEFTLKEMLIAVAVGSANDASVAVAEFLAGSEEQFVEQMNERAKQLGAQNTQFKNPHGLHDDEHYTTARDMSLLAGEAIKHPLITELTSIKDFTFREEPKLVLWNTNKLLWWYNGTDGLKTGTTSQAGRNLTSTVVRDDLRLIGVVMGADKANGHFRESMKLYDFGFANFTFKKFFESGDVVDNIPVSKGISETISVVPDQKVGATIKKGQDENLDIKLILPEIVEAPVSKGQQLGRIIVLDDGKEINAIALVAGQEVPKANLWQLWARTAKGILKMSS